MTDEPRDPTPEADDNIAMQMARAREKLEAIEDNFEGRLKDLEDRSADARDRFEKKKKIEDQRIRSEGEAARGAGVGLSVAYTILGLPLFGFGVGYLVDRFAIGKGTQWQSILGLIGAFVGVGMAVWMLQRPQFKQ